MSSLHCPMARIFPKLAWNSWKIFWSQHSPPAIDSMVLQYVVSLHVENSDISLICHGSRQCDPSSCFHLPRLNHGSDVIVGENFIKLRRFDKFISCNCHKIGNIDCRLWMWPVCSTSLSVNGTIEQGHTSEHDSFAELTIKGYKFHWVKTAEYKRLADDLFFLLSFAL